MTNLTHCITNPVGYPETAIAVVVEDHPYLSGYSTVVIADVRSTWPEGQGVVFTDDVYDRCAAVLSRYQRWSDAQLGPALPAAEVDCPDGLGADCHDKLVGRLIGELDVLLTKVLRSTRHRQST